MSRVLDAAIAPADVRAEDLALRLDGPPPEALAERVVRRGEHRLHLAVLGASHAASLYGPGGLVLREEISTSAPQGVRPLPAAWRRGGYRLEVDVARGADCAREARDLLAEEEWLVVRFPGAGEYHLTALRCGGEGHRWWWATRHYYPEQSTIVATRSEVTL